MRVGLQRKLSNEELMLLNCGVGEDSWDCKEIKPVNLKGNQSWILIGRTDVEAEISIPWPPDVKNWLISRDSDSGQDQRQEEKGTREDEMAGWHHRFNGYEFEQALGVGDGQGTWCAAVHVVTKSQTWLSNWTELTIMNSLLVQWLRPAAFTAGAQVQSLVGKRRSHNQWGTARTF